MTLATAAFSPPACGLLVLMVSTNGGGGVVTMAITDTSGLGLAWTEQVKSNVSGDGYTGVWTAQLAAGAIEQGPVPIPPGFLSPASIRFSYRLPYPAPTNLTSTFTGAAGGGANPRGVIAGPELRSHGNLPGPVVRPLSFASPSPSAPFTGPAATSGEFATGVTKGDPFTGRSAASGVMAGEKETTGSLLGPATAAAQMNGTNENIGALNGPAAASGVAAGAKVGTGAFTGVIAASGMLAGSTPTTGLFAGAVAASGKAVGAEPKIPLLLEYGRPYLTWQFSAPR